MTKYNASSEDVLLEVAKHMASAKCPECESTKSEHVGRGTHKCADCGKEYGPHEQKEEKSDIVEKKWSDAARAAAANARKKLGGAASKVVGFAKKNKGKIAAIAGTAAVLGAAALAAKNPKIRGAVRTAGMQAGVKAGQAAEKLGATANRLGTRAAVGAEHVAGQAGGRASVALDKVGAAAKHAGVQAGVAVRRVAAALPKKPGAGAQVQTLGPKPAKPKFKLPAMPSFKKKVNAARKTTSLITTSMVEKSYYDELPELVELLVIAKSMIEDPEIQKSEYYEDIVSNYTAIMDLTTEGVEKSNLYEDGYFDAFEAVQKALAEEDDVEEEDAEEEALETPEEEVEESGKKESGKPKPLFGKK